MAKAKNEAKIKFTAETAGFTKAVTDANNTLSTLSAELKLNSAQMKNSSEGAEKLAERKELLAQQLEAAESKTEALRQKMESATAIYGENSSEAQKLQRQVALAAAAEENIKAEITKVNAALDEQAAESNKTKSALETLEDTISEQESAMSDLKAEYADAVLTYGKNSTEAKNLAKEIRDLGTELNDNKTKMSNAESAADRLEQATQDAGDAAEDANDGFTIWKGTLADLASNAIQGAWSGITGLASSFWSLGDETRELRTNMSKVETAFESAGFTTEQAASTYEDFYGILADEGQATEAVNLLSKLAKNEEQLSEYTTIATGIYAEFADSIPIEGLIEAANETAKTGTVTGNLADALNWTTMSSEEWTEAFNGHPRALKKFQRALKNGMTAEEAFNEALTQCTTESEREQVIRQALTGLYGDAAAAYAETSGEIIEANKAQANYNGALAGLGEIIEPIKTVFMNGMASMLESATELISGLDMEAIKAAIQGAFDYLNDTVFPAIKTGIQWFIDNKDLVVGGLTAIVAGIAAFKIVSIVQTAVGAFKAFQAATTGLTLAQKALNLVMSANPVGLVIAGIAALVAGFVYLWNNCEWFREFWIGLWEGIKYYAGVAFDWLVNMVTVTIPAAWNTFKEYVSTLWSGIWTTISTWAMDIWTSVSTWFSNTKDSAVTAISDMWTGVTTWFSELWASIVSIATNIWTSVTTWFNNIKTSATNIVRNLWTSIVAIWNNLKDSISNGATAVWTNVTSIFNSVKATVVSIWNSIKATISTVWNGIKSAVTAAINAVKNKVSTVFTGVKTAVTTIWNGISSTINSVWSGIKTTVSSAVTVVKTKVGNVFNTLKTTVSNVWNSIKSAIEDPITAAKDTVSSMIEKIKGFFDFEWSLPKLKMPHVSITGSFSLAPPSVPKFSIEWYAKGGILEKPTMFGINPANGNAMFGGEAGAEAVAPIELLLGYVREAVRDVFGEISANGADERAAISHVDKLETYLNSSSNDMGRLIGAIEDLASRAINLNIDSTRVATATASASDNVSGHRLNLKTRGLALR